MICPQCKAEYRQGFTMCSDCEVALVAQLPTPPGGPGDSAEPGEDPFCTFWKGDDPRIHAELCELLDQEGIPHKTVRRADHLFNLNSRSAFQIGIPFSFFEKAEAAVKEAYGSDDEIQPASNLLPPGTDHLPGTTKGPENWYPEDATAEVWRGDQPELGDMIAASLQENQIHSRSSNSAGNCALFVLPGDEARAQEIVREIVEGAPPE
jgi:hypothetical protein